MNQKYDGMFVVSPIKRRIKNSKTGKIIESGPRTDNDYDLENYNVYNENGELISPGTQLQYNSAFLVRILNMYILELEPFLNYHYYRTPDKKRFLDYLEFGIAPGTNVSSGISDKIKQWCKERRNSLNWKVDPENPLEQFHLLIDELNRFLNKVFKKPHQLKELSLDLQTPEGVGISIIAEKAKREIQALRVKGVKKSEIDAIISPKYEQVNSQITQVKKAHKLNSAKTQYDNISFFKALQLPFYNFFDWYFDNEKSEYKDKEQKTTLKDFFKDHVEHDTIDSIQNQFKELKGKKMAILIYLLHSEYQLINIIPHSRDQSRKHFVQRFTEKELTMQSINDYFVSATDKVNVDPQDLSFKEIKSQLDHILD